MGEYEIGKEVAALNARLTNIEQIVSEIAKLLKHNIDTEILKEVPEPKEKD